MSDGSIHMSIQICQIWCLMQTKTKLSIRPNTLFIPKGMLVKLYTEAFVSSVFMQKKNYVPYIKSLIGQQLLIVPYYNILYPIKLGNLSQFSYL
jgi:hypothetical protein